MSKSYTKAYNAQRAQFEQSQERKLSNLRDQLQKVREKQQRLLYKETELSAEIQRLEGETFPDFKTFNEKISAIAQAQSAANRRVHTAHSESDLPQAD